MEKFLRGNFSSPSQNVAIFLRLFTFPQFYLCFSGLTTTTIVKPLYNGRLRFLEKVSATRTRPLYRVLDFFQEKIIIDKNLTMFYDDCDSLQLHFLQNIWIVLYLTLCNLIVSIFPI